MSKAFTREDDNLPDVPAAIERTSLLPPGTQNYLTADGAARLRDQQEQLISADKVSTDDLTAKARRQQRIAEIQQILESATVVAAPATPDGRVRFGATVEVENTSGETSRYRIVGVDETDFEQGEISWLSPIAKALMNGRVGQRVRFKFPSGEEELHILRVYY
jgi:transcription elongation factor GreB